MIQHSSHIILILDTSHKIHEYSMRLSVRIWYLPYPLCKDFESALLAANYTERGCPKDREIWLLKQ
jgi:hypothetical protein